MKTVHDEDRMTMQRGRNKKQDAHQYLAVEENEDEKEDDDGTGIKEDKDEKDEKEDENGA